MPPNHRLSEAEQVLVDVPVTEAEWLAARQTRLAMRHIVQAHRQAYLASLSATTIEVNSKSECQKGTYYGI